MTTWQSFCSALQLYQSDRSAGNEEALIAAYILFCEEMELSAQELKANLEYFKRKLAVDRQRRVA